MPQSGYTPIQIYGSGTATNAPSAANLTNNSNGAEIAINYADGKMFYKDGGGTVQTIATKNSVLGSFPNTFGYKNRIISGGFTINQRTYVSGTATAAGVYMHDRWKAGASGCTYTFTAGSTGVPVAITITAGSLQQVIEGCNLPEGGTYTMSWSGTAQGKIAGGSYAASPITVTGLTAGANCTIEFGTGTVGLVQLETGTIQTSFDYRDYGRELILCQRYCQWVPFSVGFTAYGAGYFTTAPVSFRTDMRVAPSFSTITADPATAQTTLNNASNSFNATYASTTGGLAQLSATAGGNAYVYGYRSLATAEL